MADMQNYYISRQEAATVLLSLAESGILDSNIEDDLIEIADIIQAELDGEHRWAQPYSSTDSLDVAMRENLIDDDITNKMVKQHEYLRFKPSKGDILELQSYYKEKMRYEEGDPNAEKQFRQDFAFHYGVDAIVEGGE